MRQQKGRFKLHTIMMILFMGIVGAFIGGLTNSIAIKMLFRPYEAKYIGRWRLPFTPGLIPKRREELAIQLGNMVVNHLLTPEVIQNKLSEQSIHEDIQQVLEEKAHAFFQSDHSIEDLFEQIGVKNLGEQVDEKFYSMIMEKVTEWEKTHREQSLRELIPTTIWKKLDNQVPKVSDYLLNHVKQFILSPNGYHLMKQHIDRFFEGRGMILGMLQSFLDNRNLIERIQQELVKIVDHEKSIAAVNLVLQQELDKVKGGTVKETIEFLLTEQDRANLLISVKKRISLSQYVRRPVRTFNFSQFEDLITKTIIPTILQNVFSKMGLFVEKWMRKLNIPELIKRQVDTFTTERLEEMVLSISRRELKMITYLGAYLGGLIGIVQGMIVILFD